MFSRKPNPEEDELNRQITKIHTQMFDDTPESEAYAQMADQLVKLYEQKDKIPSRRISPDTLATVTANILGIALVVGHERANVIGGKAITFVRQLGR